MYWSGLDAASLWLASQNIEHMIIYWDGLEMWSVFGWLHKTSNKMVIH